MNVTPASIERVQKSSFFRYGYLSLKNCQFIPFSPNVKIVYRWRGPNHSFRAFGKGLDPVGPQAPL